MLACNPQVAVSHRMVMDYAKFVAKADEMDLSKIGRKVGGARYSGASGLLADLEQIVRNADVYNGPGGGICAAPGELFVHPADVPDAASLQADQEQISCSADVYSAPGGGICAAPGDPTL